MTATYTTKETKNGKRYIYKIDGIQVRTSSHLYPYVCLRDGRPETFGKLATCQAPMSKIATRIREDKANLAFCKGEITWSQYADRFGRKSPFLMSAGDFRSHMNWIRNAFGTSPVQYYEKHIAELESIKFEILTFTQE